MSVLPAPDPFTPEQLEGAKALRAKLGHILPPTFDTDFFLARWFKAYNGDLDAIERYLRELITHRQTLGYDVDNVLECCSKFDFARKTFERFSISKLDVDVYDHDVAVFVQSMKGVDIKEIMRIVPLGDVMNSYFLLQECFHRAIYTHEQKTGRPSAVFVIIDLTGFLISDFINPLSVSSKLARMVVKIWSDYFTESLVRIFLVNPPGLLSLMWQVTKHILDSKTQSRINILSKTEELQNFLSKDVIPINLGGNRRDESGYGELETCVSVPKPVKPEEYFKADVDFWNRFNVYSSNLKPVSTSIKSKSVHEIERVCSTGQKLLWLFTVNGDVGFEIAFKTNNSKNEQYIWPKITLTSLKTPEHGFVDIVESGTYILRFYNSSTGLWSGVKLNCTVHVI